MNFLRGTISLLNSHFVSLFLWGRGSVNKRGASPSSTKHLHSFPLKERYKKVSFREASPLFQFLPSPLSKGRGIKGEGFYKS
jgi:hypothetical protein